MFQWPCPPVWLLKPDTFEIAPSHLDIWLQGIYIRARIGRAICSGESLTEEVDEEEEEEESVAVAVLVPLAVPDAL